MLQPLDQRLVLNARKDTIVQILQCIYYFFIFYFTFYGIYSFIISLAVLKALLFYIVISLMHKMDLLKPFSNYVSKQILLLSYYTIVIGLLSYLARQFVTNFVQSSQETFRLNEFWNDSQAFILMGAVIYIIAVIFKKGVEMQNENDLTI